jgi:hypothetical protein
MLMKMNKKVTVQPLFKTYKKPEAEIYRLLHPAQANLGYFLMWFQSLQLPSTQSESPLAPKCHVSLTVCIQL